MRVLPLAALLLVAACGQQTEPTASAAHDLSTPRPTPTSLVSSTSPSPTSASSAASATTSPTARVAPRPTGLRTLLLDAGSLPRASASRWSVRETHLEKDRAVGSCQVTTLTTIGANRALVRAFTTADRAVSALQVVGRFSDAKSAWRATEVLKSWRSQCAARVGDGATVSPLADVAVAPATGHRYVVSAPAGAFDERVGIVRRGAVVSLIVYVTDRRTYSAGAEPEGQAVKAEAALLG